MIRFLVRTAIGLASSAVGLLVAGALLDGLDIHAGGFLLAVVIFTITIALLMPFLADQLRRIGLERARRSCADRDTGMADPDDVISDGLSIDGVGTWLAAW